MPAATIFLERTVEFAETDAAGLLHFSRYFQYVESAERALFERWGEPLLDERGAELAGFPRVRVRCDYSAPLRFGDRAGITLSVEAWTARSIEYRFLIERLAPGPRERVARGRMTTVHARLDRAGGRLESASLPPGVRAALEAGEAGHP